MVFSDGVLQLPIIREMKAGRHQRSKKLQSSCSPKHRPTYPIYGFAQLDHRFAHISTTNPALHLIPASPDASLPLSNIQGKFVRDRLHVRLRSRQEVVSQPASVEQRPRDLRLSSEYLTKRLTSRGIGAWLQGIGINVTSPL